MGPPNTYVKPSKIHGLGLFAKVDIKAGENIEHGVPDYSVDVDAWIKYNKSKMQRSKNLCLNLCMINHADKPNTHRPELERVVASRDIKAGEEITEDYNLLPEGHNPFAGHWEDLLWEIIQNRKYA